MSEGKTGGDAAGRLIVALDKPDAGEAYALCDALAGIVGWVKVGLELFTAAGPEVVVELRRRGLEVFLDLKFHDIPNTVERACARAAGWGVSMMNVHAGGGEAMMSAAAAGARAGADEAGLAAPTVLAVTVLTSLSGDELPGYYAPRPVPDRVVLLARAARDAGLDGVVASARELSPLRGALGAGFTLLTPGIRFAGGEAGDQKRVVTPGRAVADGADFLVIGRPITGAADPAVAARRALSEMSKADS